MLVLTTISFAYIKAQTSIDQSYFINNLPTYIWDIAGSPYLIESDIKIPFGSDLIIQPDVEVLFQGHYKMDVKGSIHANGTSKNRISFTSNVNTPWNGIRFDFSDGTSPTPSGLYNCDISNAQKTGTNCQFPDPESSGGAIYVQSFSDLEVVDCNIFNNSVQAHGGAIGIFESSSPLIRNCSIHSNFAKKRGGGIAIYRNSDPAITGNNIYENEAKKGGGALAIGILNNINAPNNPMIQNNSFTDNYVSGLSGYGDGGAVFVCGSNPEITNNTFERNSAHVKGGAIYIKKHSNVTLDNNTFSDNQATSDGGGIYVLYSSTVSISSSQFNNNSAINGGAFYVDGSTANISVSSFEANTASTDGGAIYASQSTTTIENNTFEDNTATGNGGGVFMDDPQKNSIDLNSFKSNIAYQGSALYYLRSLYNNQQSVKNNLFAENQATNMATVYMQGDNRNTIFNHNTVTNNSAGTYYWVPGVCVEKEIYLPLVDNNHFNLYNNIIYDTWSDIVVVFDANGNLLLQIPSNYDTLAGYNYLNRDNSNPSNPNPSPAFVSTTDYHLTSSSPCKDAGINLNTPFITGVDLDGNQRINNGTTDFGCYEY